MTIGKHLEALSRGNDLAIIYFTVPTAWLHEDIGTDWDRYGQALVAVIFEDFPADTRMTPAELQRAVDLATDEQVSRAREKCRRVV